VYNSHPLLTPALLGVNLCDLGSGEGLDLAVAVMKKLGKHYSIDAIPPEIVERLGMRPDTILALDEIDRILEARPPLSAIALLLRSIQEILQAVEFKSPGARVTPGSLAFAPLLCHCC
jgi:hypothetical protein